MRHALLILPIALLHTACGGTSFICDATVSRFDSANWIVSLDERSGGTCGALTDVVVDPSTAGTNCMFVDAPDLNDRCSYNARITCDDGTITSTETYALTRTGENHAKGAFTLVVNGVCVSTYDVDAEKL